MISDSLHSFRISHVTTVSLDVTEGIKLPCRYLEYSSFPTGVSNYSAPSELCTGRRNAFHLSVADGKIEGRVGICPNPLITICYQVAQVGFTNKYILAFLGLRM